MKPDRLRLCNRLVETILDKLLAGFSLPHTKPTVWEDWMKGRRSGVDDLNGLVVAKAALLGRMAPVNTAIADMAHRVEQGKSNRLWRIFTRCRI
jgi:2-dehydropantoate 2-reductase